MSRNTTTYYVPATGPGTIKNQVRGETRKTHQSSSHMQNAGMVDKKSKEQQAAPPIQSRETDTANLKRLLERLAEKEKVMSKMEEDLKSLRDAVRLNEKQKTGGIGKESERVRDLQEKLEQTKRELHGWQIAYQEKNNKLQDTTNLLQTRTTELRAAQTYLSREDAIPEADVVQFLDDLNFEIVQASAILVEAVSSKLIRGGSNFNRMVQADAEEEVLKFFGTSGLNLLRDVRDAETKVNLVEIAFKACLVTWARDVIKSWEFESSTAGLDGIYDAISSAEAQAVAGRWRALTRRNLQRAVSEDQVLETIVPGLTSGLVSILVCAGISTGYSEATRLVASSALTRLNVVARLALKLNRIIGQDITSSDLEISLVAPDEKYDIKTMKSTYNDETPGAKRRKMNDQYVLCTTDLGLTSCVKHPDRTQKILVQPAVILEGFFTSH